MTHMWLFSHEAQDLGDNDQEPRLPRSNKLRSACDNCHQNKMKCSGGAPCAACSDSGYQCCYSVSHRRGRPKGAKNKRTLEEMNSEQPQHRPCTASKTPLTPSHTGAGKNLVSFDTRLIGAGLNHGTSLPLGSDAFWGLFDNSRGDELEVKSMMEYKLQPHKAYETCHFFDASSKASAEEPHFFSDDQPTYAHSAAATGLADRRTTSTISSTRMASLPSDGDDYSSAPQLSMSSSSSSSPPCTTDALSTCNCLQQHTELLCLLKNLDQGNNTSSVDVVLSSVQQALPPWQNLIQCGVCQHDDDQSVLLLSVMSIRAVLHRLQRLCAHSVYNASTLGCSAPVRQTMTSVKVTIGDFELSGNERKFVTDFMILQALGKVRVALHSLKEKLDQPRDQTTKFNPISLSSITMQPFEDEPQLSSVEPTVYIGHINQLLRSLEGIVQAVESTIKTNLAAIHGNGNSVLGVR